MARLVALALATTTALAGAACKKAGSNEPSLVADAKGPAGMTWKPHTQPYGTIEIPAAEGWKLEGDQVEGPEGTVVMLSSESGVDPADQREDWFKANLEANTRDAPKYARTGTSKGSVNGNMAARIEATFELDEPYVIRDYVVQAGTNAIFVSARTPTKNAAALAPIVDHMVSSIKAN
jgi:hypothetical protein